jgi:hypothetical protein
MKYNTFETVDDLIKIAEDEESVEVPDIAELQYDLGTLGEASKELHPALENIITIVTKKYGDTGAVVTSDKLYNCLHVIINNLFMQ